jgi:acetoin utilization deacetylase AcuC-like enzyme
MKSDQSRPCAVAYISHASSGLHQMGDFHPECPERVAVIADRLIATGLMPLLRCYDAPAASAEQISRAHAAHHYDHLLAAAPKQGLIQLDPDTAMNPHTFEAARHAAGAAVLAADLVCTGQAQRAFCNVRPPGHHAQSDRAMGFCFFNNIAVGIHHALAVHQIERIALIDFDVHHGNGSEEIFANDQRVLMVSTFQSPLYPYSGEQPLGENMLNLPLPPYSDGRQMRAAVSEHWLPRLDAFAPQMLWISAGFDAHEHDELSHLRWHEADYRWLSEQLRAIANRHCQGRIVSALEGGYNLPALAASVEQHVRVLLDLEI